MSTTRFTFRKNERLCLNKQIDRIFANGRWLKSQHFRVLYLEVEEELPSVAQVMFSVPKKIHRTAVTRNLLKRRMRESYRTKKNNMYEALQQVNKKMLLAFVYNSENIAEFSVIDKEINYLLAQLNSRILQNIH